MTRKIVPDLVRDQTLTILAPGLPAREAAKAMADRNIGAVLVAEQGRLVGICSEAGHQSADRRQGPGPGHCPYQLGS